MDENNIAEEYLSYVCLVKDKEGEIVIPAKYHSESHVEGVKSAIKSLYKSDKVAVSEEVNLMFSEFMGGYKRKVEELKVSGDMS